MGALNNYLCLLAFLTVPAVFGPEVALCAPNTAHRVSLEQRLRPLVEPAGAVLIVAPGGDVLAGVNADDLLVPASVLKILTSLAAMHTLGESYRFPTDFYLSPEGDLKVKGYGDPLLVSERLDRIGRQLAERIAHIRDLVPDDSYIAQPVQIPGRSHSARPYDAPNGALCVNFNTVSFKRVNGLWMSAESQTPLLESVLPKIKASGLVEGRITLVGSGGEGAYYAGEMLRHFIKKAGIAHNGRIVLGTVDPASDRLVWRYESEDPLTAVITGLLVHSNNYIANQLVLAMGAKRFGAPATLDKGMRVLREYYRRLAAGQAHLVEGSGLSRQNRISARSMMTLLERFQPHVHLMRRQGRQWYKTGTLSGISTRAGYLDARAGGQYRFVVMLNTAGRSTDRVMRLIEAQLP